MTILRAVVGGVIFVGVGLLALVWLISSRERDSVTPRSLETASNFAYFKADGFLAAAGDNISNYRDDKIPDVRLDQRTLIFYFVNLSDSRRCLAVKVDKLSDEVGFEFRCR